VLPGRGMSIFRILVGGVALGAEELGRRLDAVMRTAPAPAQGNAAAASRETAGQRAGYLAVGIGAQSLVNAARMARALARGGRDVAGAADAVTRLPVIRAGVRPARARVARTRRSLNALMARGRAETLEGRRLARHLVEDTTARSVSDIAEFAVKEVSHSPEVAALVKAQSTGLVTDTILEVRANSEQADDRLERRVRSWLHIGQPGDGDDAATAQLAAPKPTG
jgi:hypothetical protein